MWLNQRRRDITVSRNSLARCNARHLRIKRLVQFIFASAVRYNAQKNWAALSCRPLRGLNLMCSRTVSDTANRERNGSTLCSPTVEKILCRSFIVSVLPSPPCPPREKGRFTRGWKTAGCLPSCTPARRQRTPRRGARQIPAVRRRRIPSLKVSEKLTNPEYSSSRSAFCGSSLCGRGSRSPAARWSAWR